MLNRDIMFNADRLTSASRVRERVLSPTTSRTQNKARAIVKKYRKHVRNAEFKKLRSVVPSISENEKVSQTEILEETIRYIDNLHQKLLDRIHHDGIPQQLKDKVPLKQLNTLKETELTKTQLRILMKNAFQREFDESLIRKRQKDADRLKLILRRNSSSNN